MSNLIFWIATLWAFTFGLRLYFVPEADYIDFYFFVGLTLIMLSQKNHIIALISMVLSVIAIIAGISSIFLSIAFGIKNILNLDSFYIPLIVIWGFTALFSNSLAILKGRENYE